MPLLPSDVSIIRSEIRTLVDPLLIKFRQELYGSGITYGNQIREALIPKQEVELPSGTVFGGGTENRLAVWTDTQTLGTSPLKTYASGVVLEEGVLCIGVPLPNGLVSTDTASLKVGKAFLSDATITVIHTSPFRFERRIDTGTGLPTNFYDWMINKDHFGYTGSDEDLLNDDNYLLSFGKIDPYLHGEKTMIYPLALSYIKDQVKQDVYHTVGWSVDEAPSSGQYGPIHFINYPFEFLELNAYTTSPVIGSDVKIAVEWTDGYNPYINGSGVVWNRIVGEYGTGTGGATIYVPTDLVIQSSKYTGRAIQVNQNDNQKPRSKTGPNPEDTILPSGQYGIWLRMVVLQGSGATNLTVQCTFKQV